MKTKPVTPYARLMEKYQQAISRATWPRRVSMWVYPEKRLNEGWHLTDLAERVRAADQLGYDVRLVWVAGEGLKAQYVKRFVEP